MRTSHPSHSVEDSIAAIEHYKLDIAQNNPISFHRHKQIIQLSSTHKDYRLFQFAYGEAYRLDKDVKHTYLDNLTLMALGVFGETMHAWNLFLKMHTSNVSDPATYASIISIMGNHSTPHAANQALFAFERALDKKMVSRKICLNLMYSGAYLGRVDLVNRAQYELKLIELIDDDFKKKFECALSMAESATGEKISGIKAEDDFSSFKKCAAVLKNANQHRNIELVKKAYQAILDKNLDDDPQHQHLLNITIRAAGFCGDVEFAHEAYQTSIANGVMSGVTHLNMIKAAGDNHHLQYAKEAFANVLDASKTTGSLFKNSDKASITPFSDDACHNAMISAMTNCGHFEEAWKIYDNLIQLERKSGKKISGPITHTAIIGAAGSYGHVERAWSAYQNSNSNDATGIIHLEMMTAAAKNQNIPYLDKAKENALKLCENGSEYHKTVQSRYQKELDRMARPCVYEDDNLIRLHQKTVLLNPLNSVPEVKSDLSALKQIYNSVYQEEKISKEVLAASIEQLKNIERNAEFWKLMREGFAGGKGVLFLKALQHHGAYEILFPQLGAESALAKERNDMWLEAYLTYRDSAWESRVSHLSNHPFKNDIQTILAVKELPLSASFDEIEEVQKAYGMTVNQDQAFRSGFMLIQGQKKNFVADYDYQRTLYTQPEVTPHNQLRMG